MSFLLFLVPTRRVKWDALGWYMYAVGTLAAVGGGVPRSTMVPRFRRLCNPLVVQVLLYEALRVLRSGTKLHHSYYMYLLVSSPPSLTLF